MIATTNIDEASVVGDLRSESRYAFEQILDAFQYRRPLQPQGMGDELIQKLRKCSVGHALQDVGDEHVPDVRVRPTFSGCEKQSLREDGVKKLLSRPRSIRMQPDGLVVFAQRPVVAQAARVLEEVSQRHRRRNFYLGQPITNRHVKAERSGFGQAQGANGGQSLRDAVHRENRVRAEITRVVTQTAIDANRYGNRHWLPILSTFSSTAEPYRLAGTSARIERTLSSTLNRAVSITIRPTSQGR
jgi:hypothetical protein